MPLLNAHGTLLKKGDGASPEVFTAIARLKELKPPALTRQTFEDLIQNTDFNEFIVGIGRTGEMTFKISYDPSDATHDDSTGLIAEWKNATKKNYEVVFTDGSIWKFAAYVTNFAADVPVEGIVMADVTLRPTGAMTFV